MANQMKILIVGGNSYVGSTLTQAFVHKHQVFSTHHHSYTPVKGAIYLPLPQLSEKNRCSHLLYSVEPDVVIYCLGSNNVEEAENDPKKAMHVHSGGVTHLIQGSDMIKARFIYISSDYIFAGDGGNFSENDTTLPTTQLGKAKIGAENFIKSSSLNHVIIRCAPLLGRGTLDHPSWLDLIREKLVRERRVSMPLKSIHNPVHVSFLAEVIERAIEQDIRGKTLHVGGLTKVSLLDCVRQFVKKFGFSPEQVEDSTAELHGSPLDYSLNLTETLKLLEAKPLLLQQSFDLLK